MHSWFTTGSILKLKYMYHEKPSCMLYAEARNISNPSNYDLIYTV